MNNIELHIRELILDGFTHNIRYQIGTVVEAELSRLFTEQGVPPSLMKGEQIANINGGAFTIAPGNNPEAIGAQVAKAVYGGLSHE